MDIRRTFNNRSFYFCSTLFKSSNNYYTEFLAKRYDRRSQVFFSAVTIITSILVETAGGLYAGAIVIKTFFPELIIWKTTIFLALFAGLYSFWGLKAVVYTDSLQAIILIVGSSILTYILFEKIDFSIDKMILLHQLVIFQFIDQLTIQYSLARTIFGVPYLDFGTGRPINISSTDTGSKEYKHADGVYYLVDF